MPRSVVYPPNVNADNYGEKLLKYVPAEVIAFFVPAFEIVKDLSLIHI